MESYHDSYALFGVGNLSGFVPSTGCTAPGQLKDRRGVLLSLSSSNQKRLKLGRYGVSWVRSEAYTLNYMQLKVVSKMQIRFCLCRAPMTYSSVVHMSKKKEVPLIFV